MSQSFKSINSPQINHATMTIQKDISTYWYDLPMYILFLWGCIYAFLFLWFLVTMYLCVKYMIFRFCNISCRIGEESVIAVNE